MSSATPVPMALARAHISGAIGVEESRNAEAGIAPEAERVEEIVIDAAIDDVDAAQSGGGAHVDDVVVNEQVAAFDEFDAHLLREKCVLEIGGVEDSGREQHDGGLLAACEIWRS